MPQPLPIQRVQRQLHQGWPALERMAFHQAIGQHAISRTKTSFAQRDGKACWQRIRGQCRRQRGQAKVARSPLQAGLQLAAILTGALFGELRQMAESDVFFHLLGG